MGTFVGGSRAATDVVDGLSGADALLAKPFRVVFDPTRRLLYVAEHDAHAVRQVDPVGTVTTVAGGLPGLLDAVGTAARFYYPRALALRDNTLLVAGDNNRVRTIDLGTRAVSTIAGGGGDVDGAPGRLFGPEDIAVAHDGTKAFIADRDSYTVRALHGLADGTHRLSTVAGVHNTSGHVDGDSITARFAAPRCVALAPGGSTLYVGQPSCVRAVDLIGRYVTTFAGACGTPGLQDSSEGAAQFDYPAGLAVDTTGALYVADYLNDKVRVVSPLGVVTSLDFAATRPVGLAWDHGAGVLYVAATGSNNVLAVGSGSVTTTAGTLGDGGSFASGLPGVGRFGSEAVDIVDAGGWIYIAFPVSHCVVPVVSRNIQPTTDTIGACGTVGLVNNPASLAVQDGATLLIGQRGAILSVLLRQTAAVRLAGDGSAATDQDGQGSAARMSVAAGLAVVTPNPLYNISSTYDGRTFFSDQDNALLRTVSRDGTVATVAGASRVFEFLDGNATAARFQRPRSLAWHPRTLAVFIVDGLNDAARLRRYSIVLGAVDTVLHSSPYFADGQRSADMSVGLVFLEAVKLTPDGGGLYIADSTGRSIRRLDIFSEENTRVLAGGAPLLHTVVGGPPNVTDWAAFRDGAAFDAGRVGPPPSVNATSFVALAGLQPAATARVSPAALVGSAVGVSFFDIALHVLRHAALEPVSRGSAEYTVASLTKGGISGPTPLAFDPRGDSLFVAGTADHRLYQYNLTTAAMWTYAGADERTAVIHSGHRWGDWFRGPTATAVHYPPGRAHHADDPVVLLADRSVLWRIDAARSVNDVVVRVMGTNTAATDALHLGIVRAIAVDTNASGGVTAYLAEADAHTVRTVDDVVGVEPTKGTADLFAGRPSVRGYQDGWRLAATFSEPTSLARYPTNASLPMQRLYVGEAAGCAVRVIEVATGVVSTIASGSSVGCGSAVRADAATGGVLAVGTVHSLALAPAFYADPAGRLAADDGRYLFTSESLATGGVVVRRIDLWALRSGAGQAAIEHIAGDAATRHTTTQYGSGASAAFTSAPSLAIAPTTGTLFAGIGGEVLTVARAAGRLTTLLGNTSTTTPARALSLGLRTNSTMHTAGGVAVDRAGSRYVVADYHSRVLVTVPLSTTSGSPSVLLGGAAGITLDPPAFAFPADLALDHGRRLLYVADSTAVLRINLATETMALAAGDTSVPGTPDGALGTNRIQFTTGIAVLSAGRETAVVAALVFTDKSAHTVRRLNLSSTEVLTIAGARGVPGDADGPGQGTARFDSPSGVAVSQARRVAYVVEGTERRVRALDLGSLMVSTLVAHLPPPPGGEAGPGGLPRLDPAELTLYITDNAGGMRRFAIPGDGRPIDVAGSSSAAAWYRGAVVEDDAVQGGPDAAELSAGLQRDWPVAAPAAGTTIHGSAAAGVGRSLTRGMTADGSTPVVTTQDGLAAVRVDPSDPGWWSRGSAAWWAADLLPPSYRPSADPERRPSAAAYAPCSAAQSGRPQDTHSVTAAECGEAPDRIYFAAGAKRQVVYSLLLAPTGTEREHGQLLPKATGPTVFAGRPGMARVVDGPVATAGFAGIRKIVAVPPRGDTGAPPRLLVADVGCVRSIDLAAGAVSTIVVLGGIANLSATAEVQGLVFLHILRGGVRLEAVLLTTDHIVATAYGMGGVLGRGGTLNASVMTGRVGAPAHVDGVGTDARHQHTRGVVVAGDVAYVADMHGHCLRRVDLSTTAVTTITSQLLGQVDGPGAVARWVSPFDLFLSGDGSALYVAGGRSLRRLVLHGAAGEVGSVETVAGSVARPGTRAGPGDRATFQNLRWGARHPVEDRFVVPDRKGARIVELTLRRTSSSGAWVNHVATVVGTARTALPAQPTPAERRFAVLGEWPLSPAVLRAGPEAAHGRVTGVAYDRGEDTLFYATACALVRATRAFRGTPSDRATPAAAEVRPSSLVGLNTTKAATPERRFEVVLGTPAVCSPGGVATASAVLGAPLPRTVRGMHMHAASGALFLALSDRTVRVVHTRSETFDADIIAGVPASTEEAGSATTLGRVTGMHSLPVYDAGRGGWVDPPLSTLRLIVCDTSANLLLLTEPPGTAGEGSPLTTLAGQRGSNTTFTAGVGGSARLWAPGAIVRSRLSAVFYVGFGSGIAMFISGSNEVRLVAGGGDPGAFDSRVLGEARISSPRFLAIHPAYTSMGLGDVLLWVDSTAPRLRALNISGGYTTTLLGRNDSFVARDGTFADAGVVQPFFAAAAGIDNHTLLLPGGYVGTVVAVHFDGELLPDPSTATVTPSPTATRTPRASPTPTATATGRPSSTATQPPTPTPTAGSASRTHQTVSPTQGSRTGTPTLPRTMSPSPTATLPTTTTPTLEAASSSAPSSAPSSSAPSSQGRSIASAASSSSPAPAPVAPSLAPRAVKAPTGATAVLGTVATAGAIAFPTTVVALQRVGGFGAPCGLDPQPIGFMESPLGIAVASGGDLRYHAGSVVGNVGVLVVTALVLALMATAVVLLPVLHSTHLSSVGAAMRGHHGAARTARGVLAALGVLFAGDVVIAAFGILAQPLARSTFVVAALAAHHSVDSTAAMAVVVVLGFAAVAGILSLLAVVSVAIPRAAAVFEPKRKGPTITVKRDHHGAAHDLDSDDAEAAAPSLKALAVWVVTGTGRWRPAPEGRAARGSAAPATGPLFAVAVPFFADYSGHGTLRCVPFFFLVETVVSLLFAVAEAMRAAERCVAADWANLVVAAAYMALLVLLRPLHVPVLLLFAWVIGGLQVLAATVALFTDDGNESTETLESVLLVLTVSATLQGLAVVVLGLVKVVLRRGRCGRSAVVAGDPPPDPFAGLPGAAEYATPAPSDRSSPAAPALTLPDDGLLFDVSGPPLDLQGAGLDAPLLDACPGTPPLDPLGDLLGPVPGAGEAGAALDHGLVDLGLDDLLPPPLGEVEAVLEFEPDTDDDGGGGSYTDDPEELERRRLHARQGRVATGVTSDARRELEELLTHAAPVA